MRYSEGRPCYERWEGQASDSSPVGRAKHAIALCAGAACVSSQAGFLQGHDRHWQARREAAHGEVGMAMEEYHGELLPGPNGDVRGALPNYDQRSAKLNIDIGL